MSKRWVRVMAAAGFAVFSILAAAPAQADDCAPLDVTCLAGDVVDDVDDVVEDTADTVTDTVDPIAGETLDEVAALLGGGPDESLPGGGGSDSDGGNGGGGNGGGGHANGGGGHGNAGRGGGAVRSPVFGSITRPTIALGTGSEGSDSASIVPASRPQQQSGLPERLAATAAQAAKSLAVVLVLLLAAVGFVLIQDRLDRKDPRLALAPLQSDVARFD